MPQATFVAEYESTWVDTGTTRTVSVTRNSGDRLAVLASTSDNGATLGTPTLSGVTWTLATSRGGANNTWVYIWTGTATTSATSDLSITRSGTTQLYGVNVGRWTNSDGFGNAASGGADSGGPSLALTTTQADSTIWAISSDWNAADGASRTARTISGATYTERTYARNASYATVYAGTWEGVGAAGSKTVGWSAPTGQDYSIAAIEILGTAGGSDQTTNADFGALVLAGQTPTATGTSTATTSADVGTLALTGQTPTASGTGSVVIAADTAVLTLSGQDAGASSGGAVIAVDPAILTLSGQTPAAAGTGSASIATDPGAIALAGQQATPAGTDTATTAADPGVLTLTGITPTASSDAGPITINVDAALLSLSAQTPTATGTGSAPVAADPGVLVLAGQTPSTEAHTTIPVDAAMLVLAGLTATAIGTSAALLATDPAALTLEPRTPTLVGTGAAALAADVGVLQLIGVQAQLLDASIPPLPTTGVSLTVSAEQRGLTVTAEARDLEVST